MSSHFRARFALLLLALCLIGLGAWHALGSRTEPLPNSPEQISRAEVGPTSQASLLEHRFSTRVQPFLQRYCYSCHGPKKHKGALDLSRDSTVAAIAENARAWELVLQRLRAQEMPPEGAPRQPGEAERAAVIAWLRELRDRDARRNAGDPGPVLARRLSNAEYDHTSRDLTGVDIRPMREFPVDPANEAGFDNSGESLAMSPALLKKYLAAARHVAEHVVLKPEGIAFAPHPVVTDTDRDRYCVSRIIAFYERHKVDLADYFLAAWWFQHRAALDKPRPPCATLQKRPASAPGTWRRRGASPNTSCCCPTD